MNERPMSLASSFPNAPSHPPPPTRTNKTKHAPEGHGGGVEDVELPRRVDGRELEGLEEDSRDGQGLDEGEAQPQADAGAGAEGLGGWVGGWGKVMSEREAGRQLSMYMTEGEGGHSRCTPPGGHPWGARSPAPLPTAPACVCVCVFMLRERMGRGASFFFHMHVDGIILYILRESVCVETRRETDVRWHFFNDVICLVKHQPRPQRNRN